MTTWLIFIVGLILSTVVSRPNRIHNLKTSKAALEITAQVTSLFTCSIAPPVVFLRKIDVTQGMQWSGNNKSLKRFLIMVELSHLNTSVGLLSSFFMLRTGQHINCVSGKETKCMTAIKKLDLYRPTRDC